MKNKKDKVYGVLFGGAVGDALGLGAEFMTKEEVIRHYPDGLNSYEQIIQDKHRLRWQIGDWTDDTDQMLCIAKAIIKDKKICQTTVAQQFYAWFKDRPMGIGRHTFNVFSLPEYTKYPEKAANLIWKLSSYKSASNGAAMRTAIVGLLDNTIKNAEDICKLTHPDPRCIGSCVIISLLINRVINGQSLTVDEMMSIGERYDERIKEYIQLALNTDISLLQLDESGKIGYTLKTLSVGLWAYFHCDDFASGLKAVVNEGGDADTNATVACSILGAKYGYSSIPKIYIDKLLGKEGLYVIANELINIIEKR